MHCQKIDLDLNNLDKIYYVSGYDNHNLRKNASINTKPQKVQMKLFTDLYPDAQYYKQHLLPVLLDKKGNATDKIFQVYTDIHRFFDNEQDSIDHYNKCVDKIATNIEEFKIKTLKNKI